MLLNPKAIGREVRIRRRLIKKSQEWLAEKIDTSTRTVCNIETGAVLPSLQTMVNLAEGFNCTVDELLAQEE